MSNFFLKIKITQPLPSRKDLNQVQAFPRFLFITQPLQLKIDILGYVSSLPHCFRLSQPLQSKNWHFWVYLYFASLFLTLATSHSQFLCFRTFLYFASWFLTHTTSPTKIYSLVFKTYFEKREKEQKKNIRHKEKEKFLSLDQVDSSLVFLQIKAYPNIGDDKELTANLFA